MSGKIADSWHFAMVNDATRNKAFVGALKRHLRAHIGQCSTLDLGSGTGLLGIAADNFGAIKTTCCEFNQPLGKSTSIETNDESVFQLSCHVKLPKTTRPI